MGRIKKLMARCQMVQKKMQPYCYCPPEHYRRYFSSEQITFVLVFWMSNIGARHKQMYELLAVGEAFTVGPVCSFTS